VCRGAEIRTIGTVDAEAAASAWIEAWTRSWQAKDADLLAPVYAEQVVFRSHPFREPQAPLDYARWAYSEEEGTPQVWMGEPLASGDRAAVEWWAVVVENGEPVSLAGTSWLRFDGDGRVVDQHDYWGTAPGRTAPWEGWAPSR
jgi:ketosteroid isomerase-like protein